MKTLYRYIFTQSILIINLKLCASKLYLKPDYDLGYDLQNSLESDEENDLVIMLPNNINIEHTDQSTDLSHEAMPKGELLDTDSDSEETGLDLEVEDLNLNNNQKAVLRKRWRSSCDKKASKTCTVACKNTYKIVCDSYKCKKRMKREFRKECRRNCRAKFVGSTGSRTSSDTE